MRLFFLLLLVLLSACATPKRTQNYERAEPEKGKALVYVYRSPATIDAMNPDVPRFYVDEVLLGKLVVGGYYVLAVDPGAHTAYYKDSLFGLPLPWKNQEIHFNVAAGQKYFLKYLVDFQLLEGKTFRFWQVPNDFGGYEIQSTQLLQN